MKDKVELKKGTQAQREDIEALEEFLGRALPESYIDFISKYDGAVPDDNYIKAESFNDGDINIRNFIPVSEIIQLAKDIDFVFENTFPIAGDDCGNFICLDIRNGHILFWDHEICYTEEDEKFIAEDINQLVSQLVSISEIDIGEPDVISIYVDPEFMELQRKLGNCRDPDKDK